MQVTKTNAMRMLDAKKSAMKCSPMTMKMD